VGQWAVPLTGAYMTTTLRYSNLLIYWEQYALVIAIPMTRVWAKLTKNFKQMLAVNEDIKNQIFVSSLNTLSSVTSERWPSPMLCERDHTLRLQRWRVIDNVWEIWSSRDLNHVLPAPKANVYYLPYLSSWCGTLKEFRQNIRELR